MGEIKSVKVDNWGVFFLQKLQNFFNKTDYCDLTLQFRDNSQLKVHRLVLSACTDYFNVLENTCEVVDDALIMPNELQADVVVPIVNFMYTGTLEFELRMYGKLLRTAKEMNMTVLLKLLEAHRRTMEGVNRSQRPPSPKTIRRRGPHANVQPSGPTTQQHNIVNQPQSRKLVTASNSSAAVQQQQQQQRRVAPTKTTATSTVQTQIRQVGQTTLMRTTTTGHPGTTQLGQFKQEGGANQSPSTFEQLRKGYNNNKRPAPVSFVSPPAKKPNIEDVKEFAEQQRMRKQIAAEYGEDQDFEGTLDDDIHADDDDDDAAGGNTLNTSASSAANVNKSPQQQPQIGETTITFKHEEGGKPPTIMVKDTSNSKVNHAKIISEVLRQYPHLAKSNKNIKLKIMPNSGGQAQKIIVKREGSDNAPNEAVGLRQIFPTVKGTSVSTSSQTPARTVEKSSQQQPQAQQKTHQQKVHAASSAPNKTPVTTVAPQTMHTTPSTGNASKRRIDSKTMHALISLGAENITGPWLCLRCGVNGRPISIPTYRGFRRHLINTHKEVIDAALCEHCGWRSNNNRELHFHIQVEHKVRSTLYSYPECLLCAELFLDNNALNQHMLNSHPNANKQQCIYCNKIFGEESQLFTHMKAYHKRQALEDGIIDYSDEEFLTSHDESELDAQSSADPKKKESKVKILSDISLPSTSSLMKLERSSEAAALSTVASGIATSIAITSSDGTEEFISAVESEQESGTSVTKFVNADGNEMVLTDELRKEIMSQLNQESEVGSGGVVMVINDTAYAADEATTETTTSEMEEHLQEETEQHDSSMDEGEVPAAEERHTPAEDEEYDDSQIYGEFISQESTEAATKKSKENMDESKESVENMEWAESLLSAHDMVEETKTDDSVDTKQSTAEDKSKNDDDISKKLQELTGDWSEDENDVEEPEEEMDEGDAEPNVADEGESTDVLKTDKPPTSGQTSEKHESSTTETAETEKSLKNDIDESPIEEDDLELAMENLHKEDNDTTPSAISTTAKVVASQQVSLEDEKSNETGLVAELTDESTAKPNDAEDKPKITADVGAHVVEEIVEAKDSPSEDNAVKDADLATALLDEFITKKAVSVEGGVEPTDEESPELEAITTPNDTVEDEEKPLEDTNEKVEEPKVESVDEVNEEEFTEEKEESSTKDDDDADADATSPTVKADTSDKMKSLISEWADDDEEEEEVGDAEEI